MKEQVFKAKKGKFVYVLVLFAALLLVVLWFSANVWVNGILAALPLLLCVWLYFGTYYTVKNDSLHYKSAFIKGSIPISSIRQISVGATMWAGVKPALAANGLIIRYNTYDEVYIAPEDTTGLLAVLVALNTEIKLITTKKSEA